MSPPKNPHTLQSLYPEGERESIKAFGSAAVPTKEVTELFPKGKNHTEEQTLLTLRKQGDAAGQTMHKLRFSETEEARFRRLLVLSAFHPNPYVRWAGLHRFGEALPDLQLEHLCGDPLEEIRIQAKWETKRRSGKLLF